jgi:chromosomal replication initiation ATPase DnaA
MLTTIRQGEGYYIRAKLGDNKTPLQKYIEVQKSVCNALGISIEQLTQRTRKREIVVARYICIYIGKNNGLGSLLFLANHIGLMDHSTAHHAIDTVADLIEIEDKDFLNYWGLCKHLLKKA